MNDIDKINQELIELERTRKNLKDSLRSKTENSYRKERANRLIQTGALAEKYFEIHNLTIDEREELFKTFANFIKANKPPSLIK